MFQLKNNRYLTLFFAVLSFLSPNCQSNSQITSDEEKMVENRLPTSRELRRNLRQAQKILFVYPDDQQSATFFSSKIAAFSANQRFGVEAQGVTFNELTKQQIQNNALFIVGNIGDSPLLKELASTFPVTLTTSSFTFDKQTYKDPEDVFFLFPFPNPYNIQLPIYWITGNDNQYVQQFLQKNYPDDYTGMFWQNWGYELYQDGNRKIAGYLDQKTWELNKKTHFDFSGKNDTVAVTEHFRFIAHDAPLSRATLQRITKKCEETHQAIEAFLERPIQLPKIAYHFYPSVEQKALQIASMREASVNWEEQQVAVVMNDNFSGSTLHPENYLLFRNVLGAPNLKALETGLVVRFTETWQKRGHQYWTQKLYTSNNLPPLSELLNNDLYQKESYLVMGAMAGAFMDFLITHFGKEKVLENYQQWSRSDLQKLDEPWQQYLEDKFSKEIQTPTSAKIPYLQGFNFAHEGYRVYNGYGSQLAKESLQHLAQIGTNAVAIVPYSYIRNPNQPSFIPILQSAGGENDQAVIFSHAEAQKLGMHTMLKPQIWLGSSWPGDVAMKTERDWQQFFDNYYRWARHYALLAEINNFNSYCIGVEFAKATLAREKDWRQLIQKIRGVYSGPLTYAANWGDEFEQLKFWDALDFIGLNCYYPLSKNNNPTKRELSKAFARVTDKIESICSKYNKPMVFTEIGFRSVEETWKNPHAEANGRAFNDKTQSLCYEVVFENIKNKKWCKGILWWKWPCYMSYRGSKNTGFSPNDKQTENIVVEFFKTKNSK
ncbi:MAG: hypothetical protein AAF960_01805 [Bacteroidota bacterium]